MLILIIILWYFPSQAIKLDPEPRGIPSIADALPSNIELKNSTFQINSRYDYLKAISPTDTTIKQTANKIASLACDGNKVCQAKAIYYFIRDNYDYIGDPINSEYVEHPIDFLSTGGGDCESGTIALASLLQSIGVNTQLVFIPNHAYLRIYLDDVLKRYKQADNYVHLDWTCKNCDFGEVPYSDIKAEKQIIG